MRHRYNNFFIFCLILLIFFLFTGCPTQDTSSKDDGSSSGSDSDNDEVPETNLIKTIDTGGKVGLDTSIAVDGSNIYISYYDATNGDLKLAKSTDRGVTWSTKTVDPTGTVGLYTSIAFDSSQLFISYYDLTNANLKFAKSSDGGNTWDIKTVDALGEVGKYSSIAVDEDVYGYVYISYYDETNKNLKCAMSSNRGNNWYATDIKTVDSMGINGAGTTTSITVDSSIVYISYSAFAGSDFDLKFARSTNYSSTWSTFMVDSDGWVGYSNSIEAEGSNIYIAYSDSTNAYIKLARSTNYGTLWWSSDIEIVDEDGGAETSIALDGSNVYISYFYLTYTNLKFTKSINNGVTWKSENIKVVDDKNDDGYVGEYSSIAVDGSYVYISYYDYGNGDLKFARSIDGGATW